MLKFKIKWDLANTTLSEEAMIPTLPFPFPSDRRLIPVLSARCSLVQTQEPEMTEVCQRLHLSLVLGTVSVGHKLERSILAGEEGVQALPPIPVPTYLVLCSHLWLCLPATGIVFSQFPFSAKTLRGVRISQSPICSTILEFRAFKNLNYLRSDTVRITDI